MNFANSNTKTKSNYAYIKYRTIRHCSNPNSRLFRQLSGHKLQISAAQEVLSI